MITSLYQSLCNMETNIADRVALRWYDEEKQGVAEVHYAQYAQDLRRFVAFLRAEYGDVRGKRVAILARNSYQYVICMYGTVIAGGVAVPLVTKEEDHFRLTAAALEAAITPKTKLLVFPYPNNPTGAVMRREDLEPICRVLQKHNIYVLSDEIYSELTYGGADHTSIAAMPGMAERTVVINGFSKTYSMTGWRLGYALGPAPIIQQMTKLHQFAIMSAPTTSQTAAIEALRHGDGDIDKMRRDYDMRRRFTVHAFREIGLPCFEPEGAFYLFPCIQSTGLSSEEFCERLIYSKRVAVVPGNAFGDCGEGFIRVSYCYSIENIKEAVTRIGEFVKELEDEHDR